MSWALFKNNILKYANNPNSLPDLKRVAKLWATEYDAAIKRGYDTVNFVKVKKANTKLMEELIYAALLKGQTSKQPYDLVGELGKAVQAYWTGAVLQQAPIPIIPAPGTTANIAVTSNVVTNVGTWTPPQQVLGPPPTPTPDIKEDFEQYKESLKTFEDLFKTTIVVYDNRQPTPTQIIQNVIDYKRELDITELGDSGTSDGKPQPEEEEEDPKPKPRIEPLKGDKKLYDAVGNGYWPGIGEYGNFEVNFTLTKKESWWPKGTKKFPLAKELTTSEEVNAYLQKTGGKGVRVWFKANPEYISKNCLSVTVPLANGSGTVLCHKQLKTLVDPVFETIKKKGLQKYIQNCGGGLAVRNVTNGLRLSNHSFALAIDLNTVIYPIGTKFAADGLYKDDVKIRDYNDFDLGFIKVTKLFTDAGMTWLKSFDPMHISIYE